MKNRKLADQIMAGNVAIFANQVEPPVLKRITEVKKDPGIPECLKDISCLLYTSIIKDQFSMELDHSLYLFCGRKCDRIKAILKEPDGICLLYTSRQDLLQHS